MGACCRKLSYEEKLYKLNARSQELLDVFVECKIELEEIEEKRQQLHREHEAMIERVNARAEKEWVDAGYPPSDHEQALEDIREPDNQAV